MSILFVTDGKFKYSYTEQPSYTALMIHTVIKVRENFLGTLLNFMVVCCIMDFYSFSCELIYCFRLTIKEEMNVPCSVGIASLDLVTDTCLHFCLSNNLYSFLWCQNFLQFDA